MKGIHHIQTVLHTRTLASLYPELLKKLGSILAVVSVNLGVTQW